MGSINCSQQGLKTNRFKGLANAEKLIVTHWWCSQHFRNRILLEIFMTNFTGGFVGKTCLQYFKVYKTKFLNSFQM